MCLLAVATLFEKKKERESDHESGPREPRMRSPRARWGPTRKIDLLSTTQRSARRSPCLTRTCLPASAGRPAVSWLDDPRASPLPSATSRLLKFQLRASARYELIFSGSPHWLGFSERQNGSAAKKPAASQVDLREGARRRLRLRDGTRWFGRRRKGTGRMIARA